MPIPQLTGNTTAKSISWTAFTVVYNGAEFPVLAGSTTQRCVWFKYLGPPGSGSGIVSGPAWPSTLTTDDMMLFVNRDGIPVSVQSATVIDGSLIVTESIVGTAIAANTIKGDRMEADTITAREVQAEGVTADWFAAGSIGAAIIGADVVLGAHIGAGAITSREIKSESIEADRLSLGARTVGASRTFNYDYEVANPVGFAGYRGALIASPVLSENLATAEAPYALGTGATLSAATQTAQGRRNWRRLTTTAGSTGMRQPVPLAKLVNGTPYRASALVYNDSAANVAITQDWCDMASTAPGVMLGPGETKRVYVWGSRATYDATFRFMDLTLGGAGSVLVSDIIVETQSTNPESEFYDGNSVSGDYLYAWTGTPGASTSTKRLAPVMLFPGWAMLPNGSMAQTVVQSLSPTPVKGQRGARLALTATSGAYYASDRPITVKPGETWSVSVSMSAGAYVFQSAGAVQVMLATSTGTNPPDAIGSPGVTLVPLSSSLPNHTGAFTVEGKYLIPAGVTQIAPVIAVAPDVNPTTGAQVAYTLDLGDVLTQPVLYGVQIADDAIRAVHIKADEIKGTHIDGKSITGEHLSANVLLGSVIESRQTDEAGQPVGWTRISPDGLRLTDASGSTVLDVPVSGTDRTAKFSGDVQAKTMTVTEGLALSSTANEVTRGSALYLGSREQEPTTGPSVIGEYERITLDTTTMKGPDRVVLGTTGLGTFAFDPSAVMWGTHNGDEIILAAVSGGTALGTRLWYFNHSGQIVYVTDVPNQTVWSWYEHPDTGHFVMCSLYLGNSTVYVYDSLTNNYNVVSAKGARRAYALHDPVDPMDVHWLLTQSTMSNKWQIQRFKTQGAESNNSATTQYYPSVRFSVDGTAQAVTSLNYTGGVDWAGGQIGTFDFTDGDKRLILAPQNSALTTRVFGMPGVSDPVPGNETNTGWDGWSGATNRLGFLYNPDLTDIVNGGYFYEIGNGASLYKFSKFKWSDGKNDVWLAATWYDHITGAVNGINSEVSAPFNDGRHETKLGTKTKNGYLPKRCNLRVSMPPVPGLTDDPLSKGPDDPTMWRLYACRSNTPAPPPDADFRYQGEGTATSVLLPGLINEADTTKAPPTINNFPGAAPGALRSRATWADGTPQVDIQGDGYQNLIPAGCMLVWPMTYISSAPPGWEFCQGDSKPQGGVYSRLFARIGTTFGTGSGAGQFSLPNMALRVPIGQDISAYGADVYWATVGANEGTARGTPYTLIEQRDAWEHTHTHSVPAGTTGSSGSGHTHGIPGQPNATSSWAIGNTGANNTAALSQFNGHNHGGDTTTTGSGHTHNTVATTAASATALSNLSGVSWHPFLVINWIIKL